MSIVTAKVNWFLRIYNSSSVHINCLLNYLKDYCSSEKRTYIIFLVYICVCLYICKNIYINTLIINNKNYHLGVLHINMDVYRKLLFCVGQQSAKCTSCICRWIRLESRWNFRERNNNARNNNGMKKDKRIWIAQCCVYYIKNYEAKLNLNEDFIISIFCQKPNVLTR